MPALRLALLLALSCALPAQAQIYKWVDANGQPHFGTQPPSSEPDHQAVKLHQINQSDSKLPQLQSQTSDSAAPSDEEELTRQEGKMCRQAVQWTHEEDIPNLIASGEERLKAGQIDRKQHEQALKDLEGVKTHITLPKCLISKGEDREKFECLAKGLGLAVCSGAAGEAMDAGMQKAQSKR
ncbi:hypothetical protein D3C78_1171810 [compost metagenome]